jgi:hypothetical protein
MWDNHKLDPKENELPDEKDPIVTVISPQSDGSLSVEYVKSSTYTSRCYYFRKHHMVFAGRIVRVRVVASGFSLEAV